MSGYDNEGYEGQRRYRANVEEHKSNAVTNFFTEEDGSMNKTRIAAAAALFAGGGYAAKKALDRYQGDEEQEQEEEHDQEQIENEKNRLHKFFIEEDGTYDKSKIAAASALLLASGYAAKKTYDRFQGDEEREQEEQEERDEDHSPSRFTQFFKEEDGSVDKSHVLAAAALIGGLAHYGKTYYEGRDD